MSFRTNDISTIESNVTLSADKVLEFRHHLPVWGDFDQDQFILDSDPNRYAVVYSCRNYRYR